jgi:hypothetical protein
LLKERLVVKTKKVFGQTFDHQLLTLISKGYPELLKLTEKTFRKRLEPLKDKLADVPFSEVDLETGKLPFTIVVNLYGSHFPRLCLGS